MKSNSIQEVNALTELATTILRAVKDSGLSAPRRTYRKRKTTRARKATATTTATPKPRSRKKPTKTATKPNPLADVA